MSLVTKLAIGVAAVAATVFLVGCDQQRIKELEEFVSTEQDVRDKFGPPSQIVKLSNGNAYVYDRSLSKATGLWFVIVTFANYETQYDRIVFFINNSDIVTHYGSSFKSNAASYGMPF